ncbi:MAG: mechanosensitive ion channel family protein [Candidatus Aenigmatarchaeota archaeon]|nr:MAG: mechanosensitive ion channel family protein [Candidatus Aenigmarchaeota archaeon]
MLEQKYLIGAGIFVASFFIALIVSYTFKYLLPKLTSKTKTDFDDKLAKKLKTPIFFIIILFGAYSAIKYIEINTKVASVTDNILLTILAVIILSAVVRVTNLFIEQYGSKISEHAKSDIGRNMLPLLKDIVRISLYLIGLMFIFKIWNIEITPLLASAGIAGFAVAFAAKDTIANFFGGLTLFFDRPFKIGDRIQLESGEQGFVREIGVRSTRIKTFDNTELSIPNSIIANSKIINWNNPEPKTKLKIKFGVAYGSDVDKVKRVVLDETKKCEDIVKQPEPKIYFTEMGDFSLNFLLVCWLPTPSTFSVKDKLTTAIYKRLNKEGIDIPFPTTTVHLKKD